MGSSHQARPLGRAAFLFWTTFQFILPIGHRAKTFILLLLLLYYYYCQPTYKTTLFILKFVY